MNSILNTFIIPSIGRPSLKTAIESALNQNDYNTNVIVVFDNCNINEMINDDRVIYIRTHKNVWGSGARNVGIDYSIKNIKTEFISFLDDDDYVLPNFNKVLYNYKNYELIIHSMKYEYHPKKRKIIPVSSGKEIQRGWMGIGMSVKTKVLKSINVRFIPQSAADFMFAKTLISKGVNHYKTGILTYIVPKLGGTGKHTGKETKKFN